VLAAFSKMAFMSLGDWLGMEKLCECNTKQKLAAFKDFKFSVSQVLRLEIGEFNKKLDIASDKTTNWKRAEEMLRGVDNVSFCEQCEEHLKTEVLGLDIREHLDSDPALFRERFTVAIL
jgi:hypothetical protein